MRQGPSEEFLAPVQSVSGGLRSCFRGRSGAGPQTLVNPGRVTIACSGSECSSGCGVEGRCSLVAELRVENQLLFGYGCEVPVRTLLAGLHDVYTPTPTRVHGAVTCSTTRTRVSSHKARCDTQYNTRAPWTHTHTCPQLRLVSAVLLLSDLLPWIPAP